MASTKAYISAAIKEIVKTRHPDIEAMVLNGAGNDLVIRLRFATNAAIDLPEKTYMATRATPSALVENVTAEIDAAVAAMRQMAANGLP